MREETRALILMEGKPGLAAERLGMSVSDLWQGFLEDPEDCAPLIRRIMLGAMWETWVMFQDTINQRIDELGPYELVKSQQALTAGMVELMQANKPAVGTMNNFQFNIDGDEATARLAQRMGIA